MSESPRSKSKAPFTATVAAIALLAMALLQLPGFRNEAHAQSKGQQLVGNWQVQETIFNCTTGVPLTATHEALQTYLANGSLIYTSSRTGPSTSTVRSRSGGQGIWESTGGHAFRSYLKFYSFDTNGAQVRTTVVTRTTAVGSKGDWMESTGTIKVFDADGNQTATNCLAEVGERLSFEG